MVAIGKLNEPIEIFTEFLRQAYKEPARTGYSKRHSNASETFDGDNSETDFTVTNTNLLCINTVTVGGVAQTKYTDYDIDLRNNKIVFATAPPVGVGNVAIDYDYNASTISWIYPKDPERESKLNKSDYPRISISQIDADGIFWGMGSTSTFETYLFQIDVVTKNGLKATDYIRIANDGSSSTTSETNANRRLVEVLARGIKNVIKRNLRSEIGSVFWPLGRIFREETYIGFEEDRGIFRKVLVCSFQAKDLGELS